ncbi:MAG: hypothetical protein F6K09_06650 [Merismopedia sp. SIO2A8]|nr:hypothetical protein [Merismopedia sp. SIO2A8]
MDKVNEGAIASPRVFQATTFFCFWLMGRIDGLDWLAGLTDWIGLARLTG